MDEAVRIAMSVMEERVELGERMTRDAQESGAGRGGRALRAAREEHRGYATTRRQPAMLSMRTAGALDEAEKICAFCSRVE